MNNRIKSFFSISATVLLLMTAGCKKGTFDINSPNPNTPSSVSPKFVLSAALNSSASIVLGGDAQFANYWMGYWAVSGDYIPAASTLQYTFNTDYFSGNWDGSYLTLNNYKYISDKSAEPSQAYYLAISKIMSAFLYQRMVDMYNNIPYTEALQAGVNNFPKYDDGKSVYNSLIAQLEEAVATIKGADAGTSESPGNYDIMFGGNMDMWIKFANTVKLKILMRLTATDESTITSHLSGLTTDDFLGAGEDASINPAYSNANQAQQSPLWADVGFNTGGSPYGNHQYYRACTYGVDFYLNTNDPRASQFYELNAGGVVKGRVFGSTALEHNTEISGIGPGLLKAPGMDAIILPAFESLFLQAEAVERNYLSGSSSDLFKSAVTESFRVVAVPDYAAAATTYYSQGNDKVNIDVSSNKIQTIITQKWAACNALDPVESWSDWRRLHIPADLPVSSYPGTTAPHIPYRLLYPTSEYSYNTSNTPVLPTDGQITEKIFWMP